MAAALRRPLPWHRQVNRAAPVSETVAVPVPVTAPVGGWNTRDPVTRMNPLFAYRLDNWFPDTAAIRTRLGYTEWTTGIGGPVETLFSYASPTEQQLLAAADGEIYDATDAGPIGAPLATGLGSNRWQWVNFGSSGGYYLVMVNGVDTPRKYDGTSITTTSITGVTSTSLVSVTNYRERLFFVEKDSLSTWYLGTSAISGSATEFDLSTQCMLGGYLMAIATWTRDSGGGISDIIAFISSQGEILLYTGSDPSDPDLWQRLGKFYTGKPVGRRCVVNIGNDVILITENGFIPLSGIMSLDTSDSQDAIAYSNLINPTVVASVQQYGENFGWEPIVYPRSGWALFNVPVQEDSLTGCPKRSYQYVSNTITGAWCRFTGMNAVCWGLNDRRLFFGDNDGKIWLADNGWSDNGTDITGDCSTAFQNFGSGNVKHFDAVQPVITAQGTVYPAIEVNVDFQDKFPTATPSSVNNGGSPWNTSPWDTTPWGSTRRAQQPWLGANSIGYWASIRTRVIGNSFQTSITSWNLQMKPGGIMSP